MSKCLVRVVSFERLVRATQLWFGVGSQLGTCSFRCLTKAVLSEHLVRAVQFQLGVGS